MEQISESLAVRAAGAVIPKIGLGTWQLRGAQCAEIVAAALAAGYTHVDTAQGYANEEFVGEGLVASGVPADRVFITTKVRPDRLADGDLQRSVDESLSKLRVTRRSICSCFIGPIRKFRSRERSGRSTRSNATGGSAISGFPTSPAACLKRPGASPGSLSRPSRSSTIPISIRRRCLPRCAGTAWQSSPTARSRSARSPAIRLSRGSPERTAAPPRR